MERSTYTLDVQELGKDLSQQGNVQRVLAPVVVLALVLADDVDTVVDDVCQQTLEREGVDSRHADVLWELQLDVVQVGLP